MTGISNLHGIPILREQINFNITKKERSKNEIKYIVIHDTANKAKTADDYMHYKYFNSGNKNSSADFFVDHDSICKLNDYYTNYTWHCGDKTGYRRTGVYNSNSVGVEICINNLDYIKTICNTIVLVCELQKWLEIPKENILRHYDVTHKWCPGTARTAKGLLLTKGKEIAPGWLDFKSQLRD